MALSTTQVQKVAKLARLHLEPDELPNLTEKLNGVLHWIDQLQAVNTDGIAPLTSVNDGQALYLRPDEITDGHKQADIVSNAPETMAGFFVVPKVVE